VSDVRGFYASIGVVLPQRKGSNVSVRCFTAPDKHRRGDRSPSCSVSVVTGAFNCFVCGAKGGPYDAAIAHGLTAAAAMSLVEEHGLLREGRRTSRAAVKVKASSHPPGMTAAFVYHDENGKPLYQARRHEPGRDGKKKEFSLWRWDGTGWLPGLRGTRRVLYRLPQLLDAISAGDTIYITEGEAKADALAALGLVATTSPMGAGNWREEYAAFFRGAARVVVLPDDDSPGRHHAADIVRSLLPVVQDVRVLELGARGETARDIIDWLPDVGTEHDECPRAQDRLLQLAETATAGAVWCEEFQASETVLEVAGAEDEWPEPVSLDPPAPPAFPVEVLSRRLRGWVEAVAVAYQTPGDLPALAVLGGIAAAVQGWVRVRITVDWVEEVCLYSACILPSGERKTPVLREASLPLERWERQACERERERVLYLGEKRKLLERRLTSARDQAAKENDEPDRIAREHDVYQLAAELEELEQPVLPRLLADDTTPEALTSLLADHGRMAVISAEGGLFEILAGLYSDRPNLDTVLKAYCCEPIRVDRKSRPPEHIARPALTLVLAVQPAVLEHLHAREQLRGRGLLARFIYAVPKTALGHRDLEPPPIPDTVRADYAKRLTKLVEAAAKTAQSAKPEPDTEITDIADLAADDDVLELTLAPKAKETLRSFRAALEPRLDPDTGDLFGAADWAGKLAGTCTRIAALLHLYNRGWHKGTSTPIDANTMTSAVAIAQYLIPHALIALGLTGPRAASTTPARAILSWIRRQQPSSFKASDALDRLSRSQFPDMSTVNAALLQLEQLGWIRKRPDPPRQGSGRSASPTYDINPREVRPPEGDGGAAC
jgi:hypothetical protein